MLRKLGFWSVLFLAFAAEANACYQGYCGGSWGGGTSVSVRVGVNTGGGHAGYVPQPVPVPYPAPYPAPVPVYGPQPYYGGTRVAVGVSVRTSGYRRTCARGFRVNVRVRVRGGGCGRRFC